MPKVIGTCGDCRSILALVAAGHGVSLILELALSGLRKPAVALIPMHPRVQRQFNALVSSWVGANPAAPRIVDALLEEQRTALPRKLR